MGRDRDGGGCCAATVDTVDGALIGLGAGNSVLLVGVQWDAISEPVFQVG